MSEIDCRISNEALDDLRQIWTYTFKTWSLKQADQYYTQVIEAIRSICSNSQTGKSINYLKQDYRVVKVKSHLIFYRTMHGTIEIVRILHQRMDVKGQIEGRE